jgi:hypothetical protein
MPASGLDEALSQSGADEYLTYVGVFFLLAGASSPSRARCRVRSIARA